jgi:hypothetical protein
MVKTISFTDIDVSADGWLRATVTRETQEALWIELPYSFFPSHDLIASMLASLCGRSFEEIHIDLPIGAELADAIKTMTLSELKHRPGSDIRRPRGTKQALNFSGGFDSLAAFQIIPNASLVSLDFGGMFSRERNFFERFDPLIFRTNLVELGLNSYSWWFMGLGSILLRDELDLFSYSFGMIQAGNIGRFYSKPSIQTAGGIPAANAVGMTVANPVAGVSEIGAIQIVAQNRPDLVLDILQSVAHPGEEKYLRKYQMLEAVSEGMRLPIRLPPPAKPKQKAHWGVSLPNDLSALFIMKTLGADYVSQSYADRVPEEVIAALSNINLTFMERFNPHAYHGVSNDMLGKWYNALATNGIRPYDRADWSDMAAVIEMLDGIPQA